MSGNNGGSGDAEFDAFEAAGAVEVGQAEAGDGIEETVEGKKPAAKRGPPREAPKPAAVASEEDETDEDAEEEEGAEEDEEGEKEKKPQKTAKDHQIERLKREKRELARQLREGGANSELSRRLEAIESRLTGGKGDDTKTTGKAPDPTDLEKYPLGHLDDRYIEDKLEWLAEQKATKTADAALLRQQEGERADAEKAAQAALLEKVDTLAAKGSEQFEDFQESVVDAGMRGDWDLTQTTFEAAHDAENGAQILYELSQDPKEAKRVAKLPPIQQLKFVLDRDAAISAEKKPRTKPKAGEPAKDLPRGANSKTQISPSTDNLDDFEKAWERDAKGKK